MQVPASKLGGEGDTLARLQNITSVFWFHIVETNRPTSAFVQPWRVSLSTSIPPSQVSRSVGQG